MSDLDTATYIKFEDNTKDNHQIDKKYNDSHNRRESYEKKNIKMHASNLKYFLHELYSYYYLGGFNQITIHNAINIMVMIFTLLFSVSISLFIDWFHIFDCDSKPNTSKETFYSCKKIFGFSLNHGHFYLAIVIIYIIMISFLLIYSIVVFCKDTKKYSRIKSYYIDRLNIPQNEFKDYKWEEIMSKIISVESHLNLSSENIRNILMRKHNFLIALIKNDILPLKFLIFNKYSLTRVFQWHITEMMFNLYFNENDKLVMKFRKEKLERYFRLWGYIYLVMMPFLFMFMLIYFLVIHSNKYHQGNFFSNRQWTIYALLKFRKYNELPHEFDSRMKKSSKHASVYILYYYAPIQEYIRYYCSLVVSNILMVFFVLGFFNEEILRLELLGHDLWWYSAILGFVLTWMKFSNNDNYEETENDVLLNRV